MGCCQSQEDDNEHHESDPLVGGTSTIESSNSHAHLSSQGPGVPSKSDEQSKLNEILQDTSNNLIDICAQVLTAEVTEESEARYRTKQYASRLHKVAVPSPVVFSQSRRNPVSVLSDTGIPPSDLDLVTQAAQKTCDCMDKVAVHHKEDLVVPFGFSLQDIGATADKL